ncbi:MAG: PQQ-like beta-propeller repeat protein, partial [Solirubrobacteraceae bacterium]|nr:PQQ-like beta-propeller repeat protein [Solirubrobacteraceae bacterium]
MNLTRRPILLVWLALAALAATPAGAFAGADESTSFQVNAGHTGFLAGGSLERPPLRERWSRALGDSTSFALVAGGRVFVVAFVDTMTNPAPQDGILYALDAASGATLWARAVGPEANIAYDGGRVFVSEREGAVRALAADSGLLLWTRALPEPFDDYPPVALDGVVYVSSVWSYGHMWALSAHDGSTRWSTRQIDSGMPAVDGSYVYAADGRAAAFWREDGRPAWSTGSECFGGPGRTIADGARLIAPFNGSCGALVDAATGLDLAAVPRSDGAAVAGDTVVARDGGVLRARSAGSGAPLWEFAPAGDPLVSPPLIVNETVYAGAASATVYAVDLRTGAELWRGAVAGGVAPAGSAGMAAGGGALVVPAGGTVTALESTRLPRPGLALRIDGGPDGPTPSSAATLSFGADNLFAAYRCRLDGGAWSPCLGASTHLGLAEGPHVFEVQSLDLSGAVIALAARAWSVDTTAPVATISRASSPILNVNRALAWIALERRDSEARLECRLDDAAWTICQTGPYEGDVEYGGLSQGPHRLDVRARDPLGNIQATPATRSWFVDTIAPRVTLSAGPASPGQATTSTTATFTFSADEAVTFRCSLDSAPFADCSSPFQATGLHHGHHGFRVRATDTAANTTSELRYWQITDPATSTTPPETFLVSAPPPLTNEGYATFAFVSDEHAWFHCRIDAGPWETCTSSHAISWLSHGTHTFEVRARDVDENVDPTPARWTWQIDTVPPHTTAQLDPGSGPATGYRFTFTADKPGSTFECLLDRIGWAVCESGIRYAGVAPGEHEFRVRAVDPAGNRDTEAPSILFTVPAPEPPPTEPEEPQTPTEPEQPLSPAPPEAPAQPTAPAQPLTPPAPSTPSGPAPAGATTGAGAPPAADPPAASA